MQRWMEQKMVRARKTGVLRSGAGRATGYMTDDIVVRRGTGDGTLPPVSAPTSRPSGKATPDIARKNIACRAKPWNAKGRVQYAPK